MQKGSRFLLSGISLNKIMSQVPPTRRCWFQFSLGTMFFLFTAAIVATGWVARQANIVRERDFAQQELSAKGAKFPVTIWRGTKTLRKPRSSSISAIRRHMGIENGAASFSIMTQQMTS